MSLGYQLVAAGVITTDYVVTVENLMDIFTKATGRIKFENEFA